MFQPVLCTLHPEPPHTKPFASNYNLFRMYSERTISVLRGGIEAIQVTPHTIYFHICHRVAIAVMRMPTKKKYILWQRKNIICIIFAVKYQIHPQSLSHIHTMRYSVAVFFEILYFLQCIDHHIHLVFRPHIKPSFFRINNRQQKQYNHELCVRCCCCCSSFAFYLSFFNFSHPATTRDIARMKEKINTCRVKWNESNASHINVFNRSTAYCTRNAL